MTPQKRTVTIVDSELKNDVGIEIGLITTK
jgi:hypothetical protein